MPSVHMNHKYAQHRKDLFYDEPLKTVAFIRMFCQCRISMFSQTVMAVRRSSCFVSVHRAQLIS